MKRHAAKVSIKAEKAIKKGHPWVFESSILKLDAIAKTGELAIIFDQKNNSFLAIGLIDLASPIRIKIIHALTPAKIDDSFWSKKLLTAYEIRKPLIANNTNSFRLIHGENDGMPGLIIDVYNKVFVVKIYSLSWLPLLSLIYQLLKINFDPICIVQRLSRNVLKESDLKEGEIIYGALENEIVHFIEHGVHFSANVIHGHKTGYFLDHRHNRYKVGQLSSGKRMLDVFSYAGGFSVHAAFGGATEIIALDISQKALEVAEYNMSLNAHNAVFKTIADDAFKALRELINNYQRFDIVVIDPPSFAKMMDETNGAIKKYETLAWLGAQLIARNGLLVLASCSSRVSETDFFVACERGILKSGRNFNLKEKTYHDVDHPISFPEAAYLKCGYFTEGV